MILTSLKDIERVLRGHRTVAVVGFHRDPSKPAHYVPEYLARRGYTVLPVNPALAGRGESYFGHPVSPDLASLPGGAEVVEVFRRSDRVHEHLGDILAMTPLPKVVWLQQGIRDDAVAQTLSEAGIDVIQDRCMLADHRALGL